MYQPCTQTAGFSGYPLDTWYTVDCGISNFFAINNVLSCESYLRSHPGFVIYLILWRLPPRLRIRAPETGHTSVNPGRIAGNLQGTSETIPHCGWAL
jgi:hypothetical protein